MTRTQIAVVAASALACVAGGGALVERFRPPRIVTVTEYKDRVVERVVTVEKPVIQYRDRVVVRTVTRPDGTKTETRIDDKTSRQTGGKTTTEDAVVTRQGESNSTQSPEGKWSVRLLAGLDTGGSVLAGAGVDYRLAGPLTVGAWGTAPVAGAPGRFAGGISLGLRLP